MQTPYTLLIPGGLAEEEVTLIRGSTSADDRPGGAAATSALSLRSSSVHNTAAIGLEFMCCLNLKKRIKIRANYRYFFFSLLIFLMFSLSQSALQFSPKCLASPWLQAGKI